MVSFSPVSTSIPNPAPNRDQAPVRDDTAQRERLQTTKPSLSSVAKTDANSDKNYRQIQQFLADKSSPDENLPTGTRRGSLLDLSV
jgi:hypothetical protein